MLADYQEQSGRPFEHESRLKDLLARQAEINAALDLDKGERQVAPPAEASPELSGDEGIAPGARVSGTAAPPGAKREARQRGEYNPPDVDADDGEDRAMTRRKPGPMIGPPRP